MENERHVLTLNFSRREWRKRERGLDYAGCTGRDRMVWITREDEERNRLKRLRERFERKLTGSDWWKPENDPCFLRYRSK